VQPSTSRDHRPLCPHCRYPTLKLKDFEGASSLDAPGFDGVGAREYGSTHDYSLWFLGIVIVRDVLKEIGKSLRLLRRRHKVKKLRAETLPQFPDALICPLCLHIMKR
jgi:hypothetical protein